MKNKNNLGTLMPGECGIIASLEEGCEMKRRFMDIGLIPGTRVLCVGISPLGDPRAYLIRGKTVAIRGSDAEWIKIEGDTMS